MIFLVSFTVELAVPPQGCGDQRTARASSLWWKRRWRTRPPYISVFIIDSITPRVFSSPGLLSSWLARPASPSLSSFLSHLLGLFLSLSLSFPFNLHVLFSLPPSTSLLLLKSLVSPHRSSFFTFGPARSLSLSLSPPHAVLRHLGFSPSPNTHTHTHTRSHSILLIKLVIMSPFSLPGGQCYWLHYANVNQPTAILLMG